MVQSYLLCWRKYGVNSGRQRKRIYKFGCNQAVSTRIMPFNTYYLCINSVLEGRYTVYFLDDITSINIAYCTWPGKIENRLKLYSSRRTRCPPECSTLNKKNQILKFSGQENYQQYSICFVSFQNRNSSGNRKLVLLNSMKQIIYNDTCFATRWTYRSSVLHHHNKSCLLQTCFSDIRSHV